MRHVPLAALLVLLFGATPVAGQMNPYLLYLSGDTTPAPDTTFNVSAMLDDANGEPISGWVVGVCHSGLQVDVLSVMEGATTLELDPEFSISSVLPGEGWLAAVVIDSNGNGVLPPGNGYELHVAEYAAQAAGGPTTLSYCDTLGSPPVQTALEVVGSSDSVYPVQQGLDVTVVNAAAFVRGDADGDGNFNGLADALYILSHGFLGGPELPCPAAGDANGDGLFAPVPDAVYLLIHGFQGGPPPPPPYPECGPGDGDLGCGFMSCP